MTESDQRRDRPRYPLRQAFVVQIQQSNNPEAPMLGVIEHVSSGKTTEFTSGEALLQFIGRIVNRDKSLSSDEEGP